MGVSEPQLNAILWAIWGQGTSRLVWERRSGDKVADPTERYWRMDALRPRSCPHSAAYRDVALPLVTEAAREVFPGQPDEVALQLLFEQMQTQPVVGMQTIRGVAQHADLDWIVVDQVWPWLEDESPAAHGASGDEAAERLRKRREGIKRDVAESHQRSLDAIQHLGATHYRTTRSRLMLAILDHARKGTLRPDWRDTIALGEPYQQTANLYSDGDQLVLHEIKNLAPALWEPHAGAGWRAALESWYDAMSDVYTESERIQQETSDRARGMSVAMQNSRTFDEVADPAVVERLAAAKRQWPTIDALQERARRMQRAHLDAWYRAGLAAGGVECDWVGWFRERIDEVDDPQVRQTWLARLDDPQTRREMESLPDYWR